MTAYRKWWVLFGVSLAAMMVGADYTIVNTSLANIQLSLHASIPSLQWLMTGFGLSFCALMIVLGRLADLLGRRQFLYWFMLGFAMASCAAGFATGMTFLIAMRVLQGFFAAAIFPCGIGIITENFTENLHGRALGIYSSLTGFGMAAGPALGAMLNALFGWQSIFFINVPVVLLSLLICLLSVRLSRSVTDIKIDYLGAILLIMSTAALLLASDEGSVMGWLSPMVLGLVTMAVIFFLLLLWVESRASLPILPLKLLLNRQFFLAWLVYFSATGLAWVVMFLMPLYLHQLFLYSTVIIGMVLLVMTVMTALVPAAAGYVYDKYGNGMVVNVVFLLCAVSFLLFSLLGGVGYLPLVIISLFVFGSAWGMSNGVAQPIALSGLANNQDAGVVAGALLTTMNIAALIALGLMSNIFSTKLMSTMAIKLPSLSASLSKQQIIMLQKAPEKATQFATTLPTEIANKLSIIYQHSFLSAMHLVYFSLLLLVILMWVFAWSLLKK